MPLSRRSFLDATRRAAAAAALARFQPLSTVAAGQEFDSRRLTAHSARPQDIETPPHLLTSWITPNDLFYVRSHFYTPAIAEADWKLLVDGEVDAPYELTLAELRMLPRRTAVVTLECAGNGRAFFEPPVAGVQWEKGAVGTAEWTGVRLADVLQRARAKSAGRHVWLDGGDRGLGRAPDFVRNLPIDRAMDADTLLAYEMNGQPLPVAHGFPLRAIVPGWEGAYSVKWLTHLRVSEREHEGAFVQTGYRYPRRRVHPGAAVPAADAAVALGPLRIAGFAWAGDAEIKGVEVSTDNGRSWAPARLGRDRARYAWRAFEYDWRPSEPGSYLVLSRATDVQGRAQPIVAEWNPGGYLWNAVDQVRVNVGAQ